MAQRTAKENTQRTSSLRTLRILRALCANRQMQFQNTVYSKRQTLNCNGRLLDLSAPKVMGILNVAPDSFYDGGKYGDEAAMLNHAEKMLSEGADMIDVGGVSTRPGAREITEEEELKRVVPALKALVKKFPEAFFSIDTFRAPVAEAAVAEGASIVNDISAGNFDAQLFEVVAKLKVPYILMHMQGTPATMQQQPQYENVAREVTEFFIQKINRLKEMGVRDIILDPGFGFGKTVQHNYTLLKNLADFKIFGMPVLAGISRKSMICKTLKVDPGKALNGTTALHGVALLNGADILRVHDVREAKEVVQLMDVFIHAKSVE